MNNLILQKLIHGYQLIDLSRKGKEFDDNFIINFNVPDHAYKIGIKYRKENNDIEHITNSLYENGIPKQAPHWSFLDGKQDKNYITEKDFGHTPATIKKHFKFISQEISESQKFYIDYESESASWLTAEEIKKCSEEVSVYCPYPKTLLQVNKDTQIVTILAEEIETEDARQEEKSFLNKIFSRFDSNIIDSTIIRFRVSVYNKIRKTTTVDFNAYEVEFYRANDSRFNKQNLDAPMGWNTQGTILDAYKTAELSGLSSSEVYKQKEIAEPVDELFKFVVNYWLQFITFLEYPQIRDIKNKAGRSNSWLDVPIKKHSDSIYKNKPRFEHKELIIKMYDSSGVGGNGGCGEGKALHSVRKHLRTLKSGKKTWVKAHFRGNKSLGVIQKNYNLKQK